MALEGQLISDSGPPEVQYTYTNGTGASLSATNHEVIGILSDPGYRVAAIVLGETNVVTAGTIADGEVTQVLISGRVKVPKDTAIAFIQGQTAWWDYSANKATNSATGTDAADFVLGRVVDAAATADTEVVVDLNIGPHAYSLGSSSSSSSPSSSSSSSPSSSSSSSPSSSSSSSSSSST